MLDQALFLVTKIQNQNHRGWKGLLERSSPTHCQSRFHVGESSCWEVCNRRLFISVLCFMSALDGLLQELGPSYVAGWVIALHVVSKPSPGSGSACIPYPDGCSRGQCLSTCSQFGLRSSYFGGKIANFHVFYVDLH